MEAEEPKADSDSQEDPDPPAAKVPRAKDRRSKYVIVELPGRYSGYIDLGLMGLGWGGGGSSERGRIQLVRPPQPCREMGRR